MADYRIIEHGDEAYLEELPDNKNEIKEPEPETKELTLIKARKNTEEENIDADVIITYFIKKNGARTPGYLEIKEYKNGKTVEYSINAVSAISKTVNSRLSPILSYLGINKNDIYYYEIYKVIKSIIYGNYVIEELYRNNYIIYVDPESVGNFYYKIYRNLAYGGLPKEEYLEITQIDKISPYSEKDLTLYSNIADKIRQKLTIKTIKT